MYYSTLSPKCDPVKDHQISHECLIGRFCDLQLNNILLASVKSGCRVKVINFYYETIARVLTYREWISRHQYCMTVLRYCKMIKVEMLSTSFSILSRINEDILINSKKTN